MSMEVMTQVFKAKVGDSLAKLVLLKLADNANDQGECWPSYGYIAEQCEISKRTVIRKVDELLSHGFLRVEKRFKDGGQQSNLITLTIPKGTEITSVRVTPPQCQGVTPLVTGSHGGSDTQSPPQCQGVTPLVTGSHPESVIESISESVNEPIRETVKRSQARRPTSDDKPKTKLTAKDLTADFGIPSDMAAQFLQIRKDKRQTLTPIAMTRLQSEATKAGLTLHDAIRECCANGWAGFKAEWLANQRQRFGGGRTGSPVSESIEERAARLAQQRRESNGRDIWATATEVNHDGI